MSYEPKVLLLAVKEIKMILAPGWSSGAPDSPPHLRHLGDADVVRHCLSPRVFRLQRLSCRIREDSCSKEALFAASPSYGSCHLSPEKTACACLSVCGCAGVCRCMSVGTLG